MDDLTTKNAPDVCDSYWRRETAPGGRGRLGPSGKILDKSRIFAGRVKAVWSAFTLHIPLIALNKIQRIKSKTI